MSSYEIKGIKKSFDSLEVIAGIDASFKAASVTAIVGPSGCGKTTLLNLIAGIIPADAGSLGSFYGASFSYSFQEPRLLPWLSSIDNIGYALAGTAENGQEERGRRFLKEAGLGDFADTKPPALSGGMKRRLSLARAFAYPSDVLLLDEAFSAVDLKLRIEIMDLFSLLWREERRTAILVTHDIQDALYLADEIIVLSSRPATLLDVVSIDIPRENRRYGSRQLIEMEERLYRLILS